MDMSHVVPEYGQFDADVSHKTRLVKGWRGRGRRKMDGEREGGRTGGLEIAGEDSCNADATPMSRVLVTAGSKRLSVFD